MFLLKLLSPKEIPSRKTDWGWLVRFYNWSLVKLMPLYRRGAISETINLDATQIIHNVRDYWYEQELQRFHIDTAQHLEKQTIPYNLKHKYHRSPLFRWSENILVFYDGKNYNIKRSKILAIETDINGLLKISSDKDFILRSEFAGKNPAQQNPRQYEQKSTYSAYSGGTSYMEMEKPPKQKVNVKDTIPTQKTSATSQPDTSKYQGFEENNQF